MTSQADKKCALLEEFRLKKKRAWGALGTGSRGAWGAGSRGAWGAGSRGAWVLGCWGCREPGCLGEGPSSQVEIE